MRLKVLSKNVIIENLKQGATMDYHTVEGKVYIKINNEKIGAVRFDTYLQLLRELNIKQIKSNWLYDSYRL